MRKRSRRYGRDPFGRRLSVQGKPAIVPYAWHSEQVLGLQVCNCDNVEGEHMYTLYRENIASPALLIWPSSRHLRITLLGRKRSLAQVLLIFDRNDCLMNERLCIEWTSRACEHVLLVGSEAGGGSADLPSFCGVTTVWLFDERQLLYLRRHRERPPILSLIHSTVGPLSSDASMSPYDDFALHTRAAQCSGKRTASIP